MRKIALKKLDPHRNRKYKMLREKNEMYEYNDKNGNKINLNINKRLMFNKPYKNQEYQRELSRQAKDLFDNLGGMNKDEKSS